MTGQTGQLVPFTSLSRRRHVSSANMPRVVKWLNCTVFFLETAAVWHLASRLEFFD